MVSDPLNVSGKVLISGKIESLFEAVTCGFKSSHRQVKNSGYFLVGHVEFYETAHA